MIKFKCILIIDDDEVSTFLTEITLKTEGLARKIETASNGEEGLKKLLYLYNSHGHEAPDLILLDISMPVLDGFGFLKKFNDLEMETKPGVVVLTSSHNPKDIARVKEYNIKGYLNKPFSAEELRRVMHNEN